MAENRPEQIAINIECVCGRGIMIAQELMGRIFPCPYCGRYLRVGLQFLMVDKAVAPNLTAVCTCGRFIVEKSRRAGKKAKCRMCGKKVVLPKPTEKEGAASSTRISATALKKQLKRARGQRRRRAGAPRPASRELARRSASQRVINLKPGQEVCPNEQCGMPLPSGSNVCPGCAFNLTSQVSYEATGPAGDPVGKWKEKWAKG